jgi:hypothetical protein
MATQEEIEKLPTISIDKFYTKLKEIGEKNWKIRKLFCEPLEENGAIDWDAFQPCLLRDLFMRIGACPSSAIFTKPRRK